MKCDGFLAKPQRSHSCGDAWIRCGFIKWASQVSGEFKRMVFWESGETGSSWTWTKLLMVASCPQKGRHGPTFRKRFLLGAVSLCEECWRLAMWTGHTSRAFTTDSLGCSPCRHGRDHSDNQCNRSMNFCWVTLVTSPKWRFPETGVPLNHPFSWDLLYKPSMLMEP